jgi:quinoprotein glucose dehydrogenase
MKFFLLPLLGLPLFAQTDWPSYAHDVRGQRYSPLTQIDTSNVAKLKLAWRYGSSRFPQATPIVAGGVLYYAAGNSVSALEPETGKVVWTYRLGAAAPRRGLTYWSGDKQNPARIIVIPGDSRMIALNATTGVPIPEFGDNGWVNLKAGVADKFPQLAYGLTSPAALYKNLLITGSSGAEYDLKGPLQDIRAWDVRTGKLAWSFHLNPRPGEAGNDTWPEGAWIDAASPSSWGAMSVDEERGLVFFPVGQPSPPWYGGQHPGANLFSSSVVALDAETGKRRWHFQLVHHDIWDLDTSTIPALMDVTQNGKKIPAVVAISKSGLMFFLMRETGQPIYPVEERPVPQSQVPGEKTSATQPFPVKPPPLARQRIGPDEIFNAEPEHAKFCRDLVEKIGGIHNLGPYTPFSDKEYRVNFPGQIGGANIGGVSIDPKLGYVFVNTQDMGGMGILAKPGDPSDPNPPQRSRPSESEAQAIPYDLSSPQQGRRFWDASKQMPCQTPPWAHLTAVNANTGDIVWQVVLGTMDELEAKGVHNTGAVGTGGSTVTAGGLVFIAATVDKRFRAFDSHSGKLLWETTLPDPGSSLPVTYMGRDGKQYVAVSSSGLSVFALQ